MHVHPANHTLLPSLQARPSRTPETPTETPAAEPATRGAARRAADPSHSVSRQAHAEAALQSQLDAEVRELRQVDREVRLHERQHAAAAGPHGGAPSYRYARGPDGVLYAVAGHVNVDMAPVPGDPEATLAKALQIRRAAMAPGEPSSADRGVAMQAAQMALQARAEMAREQADLYASIASGDNERSAASLLDLHV